MDESPLRVRVCWLPLAGSRNVPTAHTESAPAAMPRRLVHMEPASGRLRMLQEPALNRSTRGCAPLNSSSDSPAANTPSLLTVTEYRAFVPAASDGPGSAVPVLHQRLVRRGTGEALVGDCPDIVRSQGCHAVEVVALRPGLAAGTTDHDEPSQCSTRVPKVASGPCWSPTAQTSDGESAEAE